MASMMKSALSSRSRIYNSKMNCLFCNVGFIPPNPLPPGYEDTAKLVELCRKYLHCAIIQESNLPKKGETFSLCMKCYESAMELADFGEQIEFIQKSINNLIFIFSMEILNRRGKIANIRGIIPNFDSWSANTPRSSSPVQPDIKSEETISGTRNTDEYVAPLFAGILAQDESSHNIAGVNFENYQQESTVNNNDIDQNIEKRTTRFSLPLENSSIGIENISGDRLERRNQISTAENNKVEVYNNFSVVNQFREAANEENQGFQPIWSKSISEANFMLYDKNAILERRRAMTSSPHSHKSNEPTTSAAVRRFSGDTFGNRRLSFKFEPQNNFSRNNEDQIKFINKEQFQANEMVTSPPLTFRNDDIPGEGGDINDDGNDRCNQRHKALFREEYPHECNYCNKRYKRKYQLMRHIATHTGDRPFICTICFKSFNHNGTLKFHYRLHHSNVKRFKCPTCSKAFTQRNFLQRHLRVHSGDKHYKCDKCDYAGNRHCLKIHQYRVHYRTIVFNCRQCGQSFATQELVKLHYREVHPALEFSDDSVIKSN